VADGDDEYHMKYGTAHEEEAFKYGTAAGSSSSGDKSKNRKKSSRKKSQLENIKEKLTYAASLLNLSNLQEFLAGKAVFDIFHPHGATHEDVHDTHTQQQHAHTRQTTEATSPSQPPQPQQQQQYGSENGRGGHAMSTFSTDAISMPHITVGDPSALTGDASQLQGRAAATNAPQGSSSNNNIGSGTTAASSRFGVDLGSLWGEDDSQPLDFETSVWLNVILSSLWNIERDHEGGLGPYIGNSIAEVLNLEVSTVSYFIIYCSTCRRNPNRIIWCN
jgi:hypothetical protein